MLTNQTQKVIVVLSAGRSGTSLLMKALGAMGMRLSENMIPASVGNPEGFFEDSQIVEAHKELLQSLDTNPVLPLPDNWLDDEATRKARRKLKDILENRLAGGEAIWGFKDPRTVAFLPLWNMVLNAPGTVPAYILAVRDPAAVSSSLKRQINRAEAITELQWLQRTADAVYHTAADCFIVHYEDWFTRPVEVAQGLLRFTGLEHSFTGDIDETVKAVVKPNLNRAVHEAYQIQNEHVLKLYATIKECRGDDFDRKRLMAVVQECRKAMNGFKGWYLEAHKHLALENDLRAKINLKGQTGELEKDLQHKDDRISELEKDLQRMVTDNNRLLLESKDLWDEVDNNRKHLAALDQRPVTPANIPPPEKKGTAPPQAVPIAAGSDRGDKWWQETIILRHSYSFRLGQILINAFTKPGKNTYMMPYYLVKLVWHMITGRGREDLQKALQGKA